MKILGRSLSDGTETYYYVFDESGVATASDSNLVNYWPTLQEKANFGDNGCLNY